MGLVPDNRRRLETAAPCAAARWVPRAQAPRVGGASQGKRPGRPRHGRRFAGCHRSRWLRRQRCLALLTRMEQVTDAGGTSRRGARASGVAGRKPPQFPRQARPWTKSLRVRCGGRIVRQEASPRRPQPERPWPLATATFDRHSLVPRGRERRSHRQARWVRRPEEGASRQPLAVSTPRGIGAAEEPR